MLKVFLGNILYVVCKHTVDNVFKHACKHIKIIANLNVNIHVNILLNWHVNTRLTFVYQSIPPLTIFVCNPNLLTKENEANTGGRGEVSK